MNPKPCTVGLTGGLASGKSTVAAILERLGAEVFDCDSYVHELYRPGGAGALDVGYLFGDRVLDARRRCRPRRTRGNWCSGFVEEGSARRCDPSPGPQRCRGVARTPSDRAQWRSSKRRFSSKPGRGGTTICSPSSGVIPSNSSGGRSNEGCRQIGREGSARRPDADGGETRTSAGCHRQFGHTRQTRCRGPARVERDRHALQAADGGCIGKSGSAS